MYVEYSYGTYLAISVFITVWVARTLHKNGRVFLLDACHGNTPLADSINHLLVVGFYLINLGYISLMLRYGDKPESLKSAIEFVSMKIGMVMLILGAMHFFNIALFSRYRRHAIESRKHSQRVDLDLGPELFNESVDAMRKAKLSTEPPMTR